MLNKLLSALKLKSIATKFGIIIFLLVFSGLLIFLAGIVALMGIFWQNIK